MSDVEADDALPTLEGRALAFGLAVSVEDILAPAHVHLAPHLCRTHLFARVDPTLASRLATGDVIVAAEFRGDVARARTAIATLAAAGATALIAERFAPGVLAACVATGVVALTTDTPSFLRTDDRVRLDLDAGKIVNLSSGDRAAIRNASSASERAALRATLTRAIDR